MGRVQRPLGVEELDDAAFGHVNPEVEGFPVTVDALEHPVTRVPSGLRPAGGPLQLLPPHPAEMVSPHPETEHPGDPLVLLPDHPIKQFAGVLNAAPCRTTTQYIANAMAENGRSRE